MPETLKKLGVCTAQSCLVIGQLQAQNKKLRSSNGIEIYENDFYIRTFSAMIDST